MRGENFRRPSEGTIEGDRGRSRDGESTDPCAAPIASSWALALSASSETFWNLPSASNETDGDLRGGAAPPPPPQPEPLKEPVAPGVGMACDACGGVACGGGACGGCSLPAAALDGLSGAAASSACWPSGRLAELECSPEW